jgi:hypothetical protein
LHRIVNTKVVREARTDAELEELNKVKEKILNPNAPEHVEDDVPQNLANPEDKTDWKKRHADLRSFTQKEINDLKKEVGTLRLQLTDASQKQIKFPKSEEEIAAWVEKYPDVAAIVETIAMKKVADVRKELADRDVVLQEQAYQVEFDKNLNRIVAAHKDFFELREDDSFVDWLQKQPKYIRVAFSDDAVDFDDLEDMADTVISAIDLYRAKNPKKKAPDERREAARGVINNSSGLPQERPENTILESDIAKMNIREYEKREDEIKKAMREGRIIYDISGAAR